MNNENPNFRLKPVAEFLDGKHKFFVPSYQRGYRWDIKQVEDLLTDIGEFARKARDGQFYCLQPIVVKKKGKENKSFIEEWEVIDGQQRLTTLFLLCRYLQKGDRDRYIKDAQLFSIQYQTRNLDYDHLNENDDIDSFHIIQAERFIKQWFDAGKYSRSKIEELLFKQEDDEENDEREKVPQVKFIWYIANNEDDIDSIKTFNNLNKGKIRLTNAELIKALFILKSQDKKETLNLNELAYEWNEIENNLQNNRIWYFLTNKSYNPATRIDLIFDFFTEKNEKDDDDYSYRQFQKLYDGNKRGLGEEIKTFTDAWKKIKEVYQTFLYWYEDNTIYHYIGYLIFIGISHREIYLCCKDKPKTEIVVELRKMIAKVKNGIHIKENDSLRLLNSADDLEEMTYGYNKKADFEKILLLFNIETCVQQVHSDFRFSFDKYKNNNWDIEHIDSQTENPLKEVRDKIIWLSYIDNLKCSAKYKAEASRLKETLKQSKKDEGNAFDMLYKKILGEIQKDAPKDKNIISNLTLLDSGTNRSYGNALFPTKRQEIIKREKTGIFIPVCTKNLFMKYYTQHESDSSQWKNSWTDEDAKHYLSAIHETIDWIFD